MWKESYRLGVDLIDKQHMELFDMVGKLLEVVQSSKADKKAECISAITYMKEYVMEHFRDEEEFQRSIGYYGLAEHIKIHKKFAWDVLQHERKMLISDFSMNDVRDFLGMLIAWLVYHVAGDDQQIVAAKKEPSAVQYNSPIDNYFSICTCEILGVITGLGIKDFSVARQTPGNLDPSISVKIDLSGDVSGAVIYRFSRELAYNLLQKMASLYPAAIDELVCSAMAEISNIISVRTLGLMSSFGISCSSGIPVTQVYPAFLPSNGSVVLDTIIGTLDMEVAAV